MDNIADRKQKAQWPGIYGTCVKHKEAINILQQNMSNGLKETHFWSMKNRTSNQVDRRGFD